ncbi:MULTISPECIES: metallophosphoesterase [unclassified Roseovarius]|uniref:metallophosphoesterase n=1 Tax=unclassified Roseovarius TaxID=2614913 RepID=UPI00273D9904|nr:MULTISPECIES: metallophosphoesterase [unclassified Roseovarius]
MSTTRILQISDPHLVPPGRLVSGRLDTSGLFEQVIDQILHDLPRLHPVDAVIVTGDVTDDGAPDSYRTFMAQMARLNLPYHVIPGNHDQREAMRQSFASDPVMPAHGPLNWSQKVGALRLIGLDTLIEGEGRGELTAQSLSFLQTEFDTMAEGAALIALHHPPYPCGIAFMDVLGLSGIAELSKVLDRATCDIRLICGHVHSLSIGHVGRHIAVASPSCASSFTPDFRADGPKGFVEKPGGYMIHDWAGSFRSTHVPAGLNPTTLPF